MALRSPIGSLGVAPANCQENFVGAGPKIERFINSPRNRIGRKYKSVDFLRGQPCCTRCTDPARSFVVVDLLPSVHHDSRKPAL
jgi:hypothetical protein